MFTKPKIFEERSAYSEQRLDEFKQAVTKIPNLADLGNLCIYVTGSYGRFEASPHSDLDLFFVKLGSNENNALPKIQKILMDAALIDTLRSLGFPEFSGYGEYLEVHYLEEMIETLGSPEDDFKNLFTARLLLLLESNFIHNESVYENVLDSIIRTYYRDYHDHEKDFLPNLHGQRYNSILENTMLKL